MNYSIIIGIESKCENRFINLLNHVYNYSSIIKNERTIMNEELQKKILAANASMLSSEIQESKINQVFLENYMTKTNVSYEKERKKYKYHLYKIYEQLNQYFLLILDISNNCFSSIALETCKEMPCKSVAFDPYTNYLFVYDNVGHIFVLVGIINEGKWIEDNKFRNRLICTLKLRDLRKDPVLHCVYFNSSLYVFVIGGYTEKNKIIKPMNDIVVFYSDFKNLVNPEPNLIIKMRYPRINPLVYHMNHRSKILKESVSSKEVEFDCIIYIFGGNNIKTMNKMKHLNFKRETLLEANEFCETINMEDIYIQITKNLVMKNISARNHELPELSMEKTYQVQGENSSLKKKLKFFSDAALVLFKDKEKNKMLIAGVGENKRKIYEINFSQGDEKVFLRSTNLEITSTKYMCNSMICIVKNELFYLDSNEEGGSYMKVKIAINGRNKASCSCYIF